MKKALSTFMLAVMLTTSTSACNSKWWQDFQNNPAQYIDSYITQVNAYVTTAEAVFAAIIVLLPADQQAAAEQAFAKAVAGVQHAIQALKDAEAAAAAAQQSNPDFTALINAVVDAITQVQAIIDEFKTGSPRLGAPRQIAGYDELHATYAALLRYKH